jgi:regulator of RNase E activity RraA
MPLIPSMVEAFTQVLGNAQIAGEPVTDIVAKTTNCEAIKTEIIKDEGEGSLVVIKVDPEATEATADAEARSEDNESTKKPARTGKGKKGAASMKDVG